MVEVDLSVFSVVHATNLDATASSWRPPITPLLPAHRLTYLLTHLPPLITVTLRANSG